METLRVLSAEEDLRAPIVEALLGLLRDRHAGVLFATSTVLGLLATNRSVRDRVLAEETFWNLSHEYYGGLTLEYDEKGRGPRTGEVYESVGHMIKSMQVPERDEAGATGTEDQRGEEKRWPAHVPYELKEENKPGVYIATLLCCPALLLCGVGQLISYVSRVTR